MCNTSVFFIQYINSKPHSGPSWRGKDGQGSHTPPFPNIFDPWQVAHKHILRQDKHSLIYFLSIFKESTLYVLHLLNAKPNQGDSSLDTFLSRLFDRRELWGPPLYFRDRFSCFPPIFLMNDRRELSSTKKRCSWTKYLAVKFFHIRLDICWIKPFLSWTEQTNSGMAVAVGWTNCEASATS